MGKEKADIEFTLKNILYFVDDEDKERVIEILEKYEEEIPDNLVVDFLQKCKRKRIEDYYDKVDYLVRDILHCKDNWKNKNKIKELVLELEKITKKAEDNFWASFWETFGFGS